MNVFILNWVADKREWYWYNLYKTILNLYLPPIDLTYNKKYIALYTLTRLGKLNKAKTISQGH